MTSVGFIGLPGTGKSTVFAALTGQLVAPQFLGYDVKPHQAVVKIPDERLDWLSDYYKTRSKVHATMEFVDIPGFDPAKTEQRLATAVLEHYRRCDALVLVVNLFEPEAAAEATKMMRAVLDELILLGQVTVESVGSRLEKAARLKTDADTLAKYEVLKRVKASLDEGIPVRRMALDETEARLVREYAFLSEKPLIAVLNIADSDLSRPAEQVSGLVEALAVCQAEEITPVTLSAALEADLARMEEAEAAEYMAEFGVSEPARPRFIRAAYDCLGLITFITGSEKECRTWALRRGTNAQGAAGVIHSDLARGFIRAEAVAYGDLVQYGTFAAAKAAGKVRLEGKEYIVADGDILHIRFNV